MLQRMPQQAKGSCSLSPSTSLRDKCASCTRRVASAAGRTHRQSRVPAVGGHCPRPRGQGGPTTVGRRGHLSPVPRSARTRPSVVSWSGNTAHGVCSPGASDLGTGSGPHPAARSPFCRRERCTTELHRPGQISTETSMMMQKDAEVERLEMKKVREFPLSEGLPQP